MYRRRSDFEGEREAALKADVAVGNEQPSHEHTDSNDQSVYNRTVVSTIATAAMVASNKS